MKQTFTESQKFNHWMLWVILIGVGSIPVYGMYQQFYLGIPFGDQPMPDLGLVVFALGIFALIALFVFMRLKTQVDATGIKMSLFPFAKRFVSWNNIKSAQIVDYGFVGGWGIRAFTKYGTVYNASGNMGLAIETIKGTKFVIGTQKEAELKMVVDQYLETATSSHASGKS